jgi:hypothetical protein
VNFIASGFGVVDGEALATCRAYGRSLAFVDGRPTAAWEVPTSFGRVVLRSVTSGRFGVTAVALESGHRASQVETLDVTT